MKYKELVEFYNMANCDAINYLEQIRGKKKEEIAICSDPELNLIWGIIRAQDLTKKAIKEYERIIKKKGHQNPAEIQKTKKEIDDWIANQNAKKSIQERKKRTQNLIVLGAAFLPFLPEKVVLDDTKIEKLREILKRNQTEILSVLE